MSENKSYAGGDLNSGQKGNAEEGFCSAQKDNAGETTCSTKKLYAGEVPCSAQPIVYDSSLCIGCNRCAQACQSDVLVPSVEKRQPPVVMYPGECICCGTCVMVCPKPGAITFRHPIMNISKFVPVIQ